MAEENRYRLISFLYSFDIAALFTVLLIWFCTQNSDSHISDPTEQPCDTRPSDSGTLTNLDSNDRNKRKRDVYSGTL